MSAKPDNPSAVAIDQLLEDVPADEATLERALADLAPAPARRRLVERLRDPTIERWRATVAGLALRILGVGEEKDALVAILGDATLPEHARSAAITAFGGLKPEAMRALVRGIPQDAADALAMLPIIQMVSGVHADPAGARGVAWMLGALPEKDRPFLLGKFAAVRQGVGVRAADLYRYALAEPALARDARLRDPMLKAIIEEADEAGSALLQELWTNAPAALRAPFQQALVRLETARVGGRAKAVEAVAEAFASNPDGQGAVVVLVSFQNPDGSLTVADVCFRLTEDLRNGFVAPRVTRAQFEGMVRDLGADGNILLVPAPPAEVAQLVDDAVARTTALGKEEPPDVRRAIELIGRVPRAETPSPPPARPIGPGRIGALLGRKIHGAWFFDADDLARFGVEPPDASFSTPWLREGLATLASSPVRDRVIAMARYMARWSAWRGEADEAAEWTTLADEAEQDFAASSLAIAMLLRHK